MGVSLFLKKKMNFEELREGRAALASRRIGRSTLLLRRRWWLLRAGRCCTAAKRSLRRCLSMIGCHRVARARYARCANRSGLVRLPRCTANGAPHRGTPPKRGTPTGPPTNPAAEADRACRRVA